MPQNSKISKEKESISKARNRNTLTATASLGGNYKLLNGNARAWMLMALSFKDVTSGNTSNTVVKKPTRTM